MRQTLSTRKTDKEKGFSLAEIIAVISVVAILMAIAIPAAVSQKKKGTEATQRADISSATVAAEKILSGYKGAPPAQVNYTTTGTTWNAQAVGGNAKLETGNVATGNTLTGTIWTNGSYCIQVANTSVTTLKFQSDTKSFTTGTCPTSALGGTNTIPTTTAVALPIAPTITSATIPADNQVTVTWSAVTATPAVTGYTVTVGDQKTTVGLVTTATISNVPSGSQTITVKAKNTNGIGPAATQAITVTGSELAAATIGATTITGTTINGTTINANSISAPGTPVASFYGTATPTTGYLIRTKIPFTSGTNMPFVNITGYAYGNITPVNLQLNWYVYDPGTGAYFANPSYINNGGWNPGTVTLSNDGGYVAIHLSANTYYLRFAVTANPGPNNGVLNMAQLRGWTVTAEASPATAATAVPEKYSPSPWGAWTAVTLVNGWINFSTSGLAGATAWTDGAYRVNSQTGDVQLRGLLRHATATTANTMFTLPAGARPPKSLMFNVMTNGVVARVDILNTGAVNMTAAPAPNDGYVSLDGISFSTL